MKDLENRRNVSAIKKIGKTENISWIETQNAVFYWTFFTRFTSHQLNNSQQHADGWKASANSVLTQGFTEDTIDNVQAQVKYSFDYTKTQNLQQNSFDQTQSSAYSKRWSPVQLNICMSSELTISHRVIVP